MYNDRITKVMHQMTLASMPQLLISDPMSIYYLTGYENEPGERFFALYLDLKQDKPALILNSLFPDFNSSKIAKIWYDDSTNYTDLMATIVDKNQVLAVDKNLSAHFLLPLMNQIKIKQFTEGSFVVDNVRAIKDSEEQAKMIAVSKINDLAMAEFKKLIKPNVTEKQVANQLLEIYQDLGADGFSFEPIVAFGKNAADPHHYPDNTELKPGDCVLFDVGCKKDGYCADMTRTFFYQFVSDEHRKVYEIVKSANELAIDKIRPNLALNELDKTARDVIENAGFGKFFTHRLGHFIGLDVHEYGDVSSANSNLIQVGMIFSIEPGIYLTDDVGVRIEDLVLVTETGCVNLNASAPKELEILI